MTAVNLNAWFDCNDEMDMDSFIQQFDDQRALRLFAVLNAKSVAAHLVDQRCRDAITVAESFLAGNASNADLERAYQSADDAYDELVGNHMSDEDPTRTEEVAQYAAMVALWAAYPVGYANTSPLDSARESALHTAYHCFQIWGDDALVAQIEHFRQSGLG